MLRDEAMIEPLRPLTRRERFDRSPSTRDETGCDAVTRGFEVMQVYMLD